MGEGSEFEKRLKMIMKQRKEQKQVVIKHNTKIYTEARNFASKNWAWIVLTKKGNKVRFTKNVIFHKISKRVLIKSEGSEKIEK